MIPLLAAGSSNSSSLSDVEPGLLGFLVVAALALALVFLLKSMNKQFRKIGPGPEDAEDTAVAAADEARDGETTAGTVQDGRPGQEETTAQDGSTQDAGTSASEKR